MSNNSFCTKLCDCDAGCSYECTGDGPPPQDPFICNLDYCATEAGEFGGCSVQDGTCDYEVKCYLDGTPTLEGSCPP